MTSPTDQFKQHILTALTVRGIRERVRLKISKGFTTVQILHRLPASVQASLTPHDVHPSQAQHHAIEKLDGLLKDLHKEHLVVRSAVNIQEQDGRGVRRLRIDVYRLR